MNLVNLWPKSTRLFSPTSPEKFLLNKQIDFDDFKVTLGGFKNTDMFIRCLISPSKTDRSITEVNWVKISSFRIFFNHNRTTFLLNQFHFFYYCPIEVKWRLGLNYYHFQCALWAWFWNQVGYLRAYLY